MNNLKMRNGVKLISKRNQFKETKKKSRIKSKKNEFEDKKKQPPSKTKLK